MDAQESWELGMYLIEWTLLKNSRFETWKNKDFVQTLLHIYVNLVHCNRWWCHNFCCHPYVEKTFGWIFWFTPFQVNWGQRRPRGKNWKFRKKKFFLKYQLFIRFNFVFMYYGQFPPKSSLKWRFVLFKPKKVATRQGFEIPAAPETLSALKGTNLNFSLLVGGNWP